MKLRKERYQPKRLNPSRNYLFKDSGEKFVYHGKRVASSNKQRCNRERRKVCLHNGFESFVNVIDKVLVLFVTLVVLSSITIIGTTINNFEKTADNAEPMVSENIYGLTYEAEQEEKFDLPVESPEVVETPEPTSEPTPEPTPVPTPEPTPEVEQLDLYDGLELVGYYKVTGYDPYCEHCCGKSDGITASGAQAQFNHTVAMNDLPFGTKIYMPGYGVYYVEDRGGSKVGVDIACDGHDACYAVTASNVPVYIVTDSDKQDET